MLATKDLGNDGRAELLAVQHDRVKIHCRRIYQSKEISSCKDRQIAMAMSDQ
jgi:hypothetical protein